MVNKRQTSESLDLALVDAGLLGGGETFHGPVPRHAGLFERIGETFPAALATFRGPRDRVPRARGRSASVTITWIEY